MKTQGNSNNRGMGARTILLVIAMIAVSACDAPPPRAVGQLLSDRVELIAESNEPITEIGFIEGEKVSPGVVVLQQDSRRINLRIQEAQAELGRVQAILTEQLNGPRTDVIAAARASMDAARIEQEYQQQEVRRLDSLRARNLTSEESLDLAQKMLDAAAAQLDVANAQLADLEAGTRDEQIQQTQFQLQQTQARIAGLEFDRQRLSLVSPVDGVLDSLPFEIGERPAVGDVVAVLLTGDQPLARVYIPEPYRVDLAPGDQVQLSVDGVSETLTGRIHRISSDATFTPYFALTQSDRSRLSFMAEVTLPRMPRRLPDGVPVEILLEGYSASVNE